MKKNIKDYIHLYLGCEVNTNRYGVGLLDSVSKTCIHIEFEKTIQGFFFDDVKLLLRPLSDMTDKETIEIKKHCDSVEKYIETGLYVSVDGKLHAYLLKQRFDIFGLIKCGLAIDKNEFENKQKNKHKLKKQKNVRS